MDKLEFRTLRPDEIETRVARATEKGVQLLLYKDARCDMNILDESVGAMNWTRTHGRDNANCSVGIWDTDKCQWIYKEDTGTESNTEAEKGLASDSFKRACVNWGIGRELYTAPFIWIAGAAKKDEKSGKWICKDNFKVSHITYDVQRRIIELKIECKGKTVYVYGVNGAKAEDDRANNDGVQSSILCAGCGKAVTSYLDDNGKLVTHTRLIKATTEKFGRALCRECAKKAGSV